MNHPDISRLWVGRQDLTDLALALVVAVVAMAETMTGTYGGEQFGAVLLMDLAVTLPLALRRRFPLTAFVAVLAAICLQAIVLSSIDGAGVFLGLLIGAYSVGAHAPARGAVVGLVAFVAAMLLTGWLTTGDPWDDLLFVLTLVGGMWIAGRVVWSRTTLAAQLAARTEELQQSRAAEARALAAAERAGIARDVHDVIGHSVSLMVVQAEAGEAQLDASHPSAECLRAIQRVGRSTLTELRTVLGALSGDEGVEPAPASRAPGPGLAAAGGLAAELADAGLRVDLTVTGDPESLSPGVDLAAYRILQEALTNVLRHAPGASVEARVVVGDAALTIEVVDTGGATAGVGSGGTGRGLPGMQERAAMYGGEMHAGPTADRSGFRVTARFPHAAATEVPA